MDFIAALQTFLRVAETGSFSAAAAERGVTQPAISRQITALEEQLATRLVERSTRAVTLTEEGRVAPNYLRRRSPPAHPRELPEHDCIVYHRWGDDNTWWFSSPEGEISVSVHGRFKANNGEAVRRAALEGLGIALLSHLTCQRDIQEGRLQLIMPEFSPLRFPLWVVYPSRRNLPARTRFVIDFLADVIGADPAMKQ